MKNYTGEVNLIEPPGTITRENIASYIAKCAGVVRDKSPKDNLKLLDRLVTEAYGKKPSRVLEYIPCKIDSWIWANGAGDNSIQDFGFYIECDYYTNARELLNCGFDFNDVLDAVDFTHYRAVSCVAPYFVYGQVSTHTQITSVSHSQRFAECNRGYWYPPEFEGRGICRRSGTIECGEEWDSIVMNTSPAKLQNIMKNILKIKRREVWARGADMLQYRPFTLGGYTNNPNAWPWFINQRTKDNHVQQETKDFAKMVGEVIFKEQ